MQIHSTITRALSLATLLIASVVTEAEACKQGYVWREAAGPNDIVCVTPVERSISAVQNQGYPNETCPVGLVWREATQGDHRCVTPEERNLAALQNQAVRDRN
jgi:hypothetical protein